MRLAKTIHEKKRRKCGKAMHLYDPRENEGQALFFSPAKIACVCERIAQEEQTQIHKKQAKIDKKLQAAILREEKGRKTRENENYT